MHVGAARAQGQGRLLFRLCKNFPCSMFAYSPFFTYLLGIPRADIQQCIYILGIYALRGGVSLRC